MDDGAVSALVEAQADRRTAAGRARDIRPLKGIRGVPDGALARIAVQVWKEERPDLDHDRAALDRLFGASFEDGLVAVGLVAAALPDAPADAWDLATDWLDRVDDPLTADALGWLVLGPAVITGAVPLPELLRRAHPGAHPAVRRAVVAAALAFLPEPLQGPAAAPLRDRVGERHVALVPEALGDAVAAIADATWRDDHPMVRKALRRVLRTWAKADPAACVAWADGVRGGIPRFLGEEVDRARRKVKRAARDEETE